MKFYRIGLAVCLLVMGMMGWVSGGDGGAAELRLAKGEYGHDEAIEVLFSGGSGSAKDWIAVYPAEMERPVSGGYLLWCYVSGTQIEGEALRQGRVSFRGAHLSAGRYRVWFLRDNGYQVLGEPVEFVRKGSGRPGWMEFVREEGRRKEGQLVVLSYNVWLRWGVVYRGFDKGIASIIESGADIVALQESSAEHAAKVAEALGWHCIPVADNDCQVVSRYPVVEALRAGGSAGARIRVGEDPVQEVVVYSCHPDYRSYSPYAAEKEGTVEAVLKAEEGSKRTSQVREILQGMGGELAAAERVPVFLAGDFNAPSHLDWVEATREQHYGVGAVPFVWSLLVEEAGLTDSFRSANPDPAGDPGITWSTVHKRGEPQDRIDFVFHKGSKLKLVASRVFTTEVEHTTGRWGAPMERVRENPWPSDHAAVLSVYELER